MIVSQTHQSAIDTVPINSRMQDRPFPARVQSLRQMAVTNFWPILAVLLVTLAVASHWPIRKGYFEVDDFFWLDVAHWRSVAASFVGSQGAHDVYRPIFRVSTYLDALLFGRNAGGWHMDNVLIHAANSFLLALVLRAYRLPLSICAAAAILFEFAPLSGESVDWISGRSASLCFLFMLLSIWRWTLALTHRRTPWGAAGWMLLSLMTYEAAVSLPVVLICLILVVQKSLGVEWRFSLRKTLPMFAMLAVFLVVRAIFLGTLVGYTDAAGIHPWDTLRFQLKTLYLVNNIFGSTTSLWMLGGAIAVTSLLPAFFPVGPCLLVAAAAILLPFINATGAGERFYYMLEAPLCVIIILPTLLIPGHLRIPALALLLAVLLPPFVASIWNEAVLFARAGMKTEALINEIHRVMPKNDGWANVVDDVPELDDVRPMMGWYFETGVADSYVGQTPPFVVRGEAVLASPVLLRDTLRISTRYWHYDVAHSRLVPIDRATWLDTHPEAKAALPQ